MTGALALLSLWSSAQEQPIVGGSSTTIEANPWQVHFRYPSGGGYGYCGGSIIDEKWILTAQHCLIGDNVGTVSIEVGQTNFGFGPNPSTIDAEISLGPNDIEAVYNVPGYSAPYFGQDLALVELKQPLDLSSDKVAAIEPLWEADESYMAPGVTGRTSGWGLQDYDDPLSSPQTLKEASLPIITFAQAGVDAMFDLPDQFPAGDPGAGTDDACSGDSGGPFVVQDGNGNWRLAGVTSWGYSCSEERKGFWAKVSYYEDWIKTTTGLFQGPTANFANDDASCVGDVVALTNSSSGATSYSWSFEGANISSSNDVNPNITFTSAGDHDVTLTAYDGSGEQSSTSISFHIEETDLAVTHATSCYGLEEVTLSASTTENNATVNWFSSMEANTSLATGNDFIFQVDQYDTSLYAQAMTATSTGQDYNLGLTDLSAASTHAGGQGLVFTADVAFTLTSAIIKADAGGNRTIELSSSTGASLGSKEIYVPAGENRVEINLAIPTGTDMEIGFPANSNLYREGPGVTFPFSVANVASITNGTFDGYYYYLYDWEITVGSVTPEVCPSERKAVSVTIDPLGPDCSVASINEFANGKTSTVYPNPTSGHFFLAHDGEHPVHILDASGSEVIHFEEHPSPYFDLSIQAGAYFVHYELSGEHYVETLMIH